MVLKCDSIQKQTVWQMINGCKEIKMNDYMFEDEIPAEVSESHAWNVANHRSNIEWAGDYKSPRIDVGDIVRVVVGPNTLRVLQEIGGQNNSPRIGQLLPAVVVRAWGSGRVNLKVWTDGTRDAWITSMDYYPVHLQRRDPSCPGMSLLHAREDTWHPLSEPSEWMEEAPVQESTLEVKVISDSNDGVDAIRITHHDGHVADLYVEDAVAIARDILEMVN